MPLAGRSMTVRFCLLIASTLLSIAATLDDATGALSIPPTPTRTASPRRSEVGRAHERPRSGCASGARASDARDRHEPSHASAAKRCAKQRRSTKAQHRSSSWGPVTGQPLLAAGGWTAAGASDSGAAHAQASGPGSQGGGAAAESRPSSEASPSGESPTTPESPATHESPTTPESPAPEEAAPPKPARRFRFFSPSSFWNQPLAADAAIDPSSAALVGRFDAEIAGELEAGTGPWINTTADSVPLYTVGADQAAVPVTLEEDLEPALAASWSAVPLPSSAQPAAGTDKSLVVWQPSSDRMWEFWRLAQGADGWSASWGGSMQEVSGNPGVYGPEAWLGAEPWWGASATSLPLVGGLITFHDLEQGRIDHALAMAIPGARADVYASPAQRDDGDSTSSLSLPEGADLRLNPALDLAALHLPPLTLMIARAAQRYGIIVRDQAANVALFAQAPTPPDANPYAGEHGYFEGRYPDQLLATFPWSELEVLQMTLHEGS